MKTRRVSGCAQLIAVVAVGMLLPGLLLSEPVIKSESLPRLPAPVSNNSVAVIQTKDGPQLFSFLGLGAGKTWRDTLASAMTLQPGNDEWTSLNDVPGPEGRLASTAAAVGDSVFVFGGYTVAADQSEKSIETVHELNVSTGGYRLRAPMPVPVDDSVAMVYANRYIYLVSGWHDTANVNLVQVFDTRDNHWFQATMYPGAPVFGQSGGIAGNRMVVCDGVKIVVDETEQRRFAASPECFHGRIHEDEINRITWQKLPHHSGTALYRAAAAGTLQNGGEVVFAGGSDNPYNYNGIGYDGEPSSPSARVFAWSFEKNQWLNYGVLDVPTMDHRALLTTNDGFIIVGGMRAGQKVSAGVLRFKLPSP